MPLLTVRPRSIKNRSRVKFDKRKKERKGGTNLNTNSEGMSLALGGENSSGEDMGSTSRSGKGTVGAGRKGKGGNRLIRTKKRGTLWLKKKILSKDSGEHRHFIEGAKNSPKAGEADERRKERALR